MNASGTIYNITEPDIIGTTQLILDTDDMDTHRGVEMIIAVQGEYNKAGAFSINMGCGPKYSTPLEESEVSRINKSDDSIQEITCLDTFFNQNTNANHEILFYKFIIPDDDEVETPVTIRVSSTDSYVTNIHLIQQTLGTIEQTSDHGLVSEIVLTDLSAFGEGYILIGVQGYSDISRYGNFTISLGCSDIITFEMTNLLFKRYYGDHITNESEVEVLYCNQTLPLEKTDYENPIKFFRLQVDKETMFAPITISTCTDYTNSDYVEEENPNQWTDWFSYWSSYYDYDYFDSNSYKYNTYMYLLEIDSSGSVTILAQDDESGDGYCDSDHMHSSALTLTGVAQYDSDEEDTDEEDTDPPLYVIAVQGFYNQLGVFDIGMQCGEQYSYPITESQFSFAMFEYPGLDIEKSIYITNITCGKEILYLSEENDPVQFYLFNISHDGESMYAPITMSVCDESEFVSTTYLLDVDGTDVDIEMNDYNSSNSECSGSGSGSQITIHHLSNFPESMYYIAIQGKDNAFGNYSITMECGPGPYELSPALVAGLVFSLFALIFCGFFGYYLRINVIEKYYPEKMKENEKTARSERIREKKDYNYQRLQNKNKSHARRASKQSMDFNGILPIAITSASPTPEETTKGGEETEMVTFKDHEKDKHGDLNEIKEEDSEEECDSEVDPPTHNTENQTMDLANYITNITGFGKEEKDNNVSSEKNDTKKPIAKSMGYHQKMNSQNMEKAGAKPASRPRALTLRRVQEEDNFQYMDDEEKISRLVLHILQCCEEEDAIDIYQVLAVRYKDPASRLHARVKPFAAFGIDTEFAAMSPYYQSLLTAFICGLLQTIGITVVSYKLITAYFYGIDNISDNCSMELDRWNDVYSLKMLAFLWSLVITFSIGSVMRGIEHNGFNTVINALEEDEVPTLQKVLCFNIIRMGQFINYYACLLAVMGSFFIIFETNKGEENDDGSLDYSHSGLEMVLNAVALFFILELDDVMTTYSDYRCIENFFKDHFKMRDNEEPQIDMEDGEKMPKIDRGCAAVTKIFAFFVRFVLYTTGAIAPFFIFVCY